MSPAQIKAFQQAILTWFKQCGRHDLPWQQDISPYRVWVSEIMLQQTQVSTVIPYYHRFMARFPDIQTLANANIDDVLSHWAGLGYYARGRNIHRAAQLIIENHQGQFPTDFNEVKSLPGIGRSTAGAICAISYGQATAILDGNVKRVLGRYMAIKEWPGKKDIENQLWALAEQLTPANQAADYTQAIMDLGAMICTRSKPKCATCPLKQSCQALKTHQPEEYPGKKPKKAKPTKQKIFIILKNQDNQIFLEKRPDKGIWGGLWSLPECELTEDIHLWAEKNFAIKITNHRYLPILHHSFTHYHLEISPILIQSNQSNMKKDARTGQLWYHLPQINELGIPKPVETLLGSI